MTDVFFLFKFAFPPVLNLIIAWRVFAVFLHAIVYRLFINLLLFNKRVREEISFIKVKKMAHNTKKSRFSRDFLLLLVICSR